MSGPTGGIYRFKGAPPRDVPFPRDANMTAVELLTFLPNYLTSFDVVYRFASNKATCNAMVSILDTHRTLTMPSRKHAVEYCHRTMRNVIREEGHAGWGLESHLKRFKEELRDWNPTNLSVRAFRTRTQVVGEGRVDPEIPFASLGEGVIRMPQGNDALDLTRMVEHCLRHPSKGWMYPTHYQELLQEVGGGQQPTAANMDQEAFKRWNDSSSISMSSSSRPAAQGNTMTVLKFRHMFGTGSTPQVEDGNQKRRQSTRGEMPSRKKRESKEDAFPDEDWRPLTRRRKFQEPQSEVDVSGRPTSQIIPEDADDARPPLRWEKAPPTAGVMSFRALQYAFEMQQSPEGSEGNGPHDAYAFGDGPRTTAPFRPLHLIQGVKCADLSGWAENLRWAREQYMTFGEEGWSECPEHMQRIAQIRQEQLWASSELMLSIQDKIAREVESEEAIEAAEQNNLDIIQWPEPKVPVWGWKNVRRE